MPEYQKKKRDSDHQDAEGKLFVGGLAWDSTEESIRDYFEKFGTVDAVNLKRNKEDTSKHRGFAFVKFASAKDAEAVLMQKEPHVIDGSKVDPKSACPMGIKPEQRTKKIFVGGLQEETTEQKLMEYFGKFGEIQNNIEFAVDRNTKKKRGFCFIEFASEGIVDRIVKDKFHTIAGRRLETKRALTKQQQAQAAASTMGVHGSAIRGAHIQAAASLSGAYGVQQAVTPYGQPVIYIHPDSLSTAYPMSALGLQGLAGGYTSAIETLYTPYSAGSNRQALPTKATAVGVSRYTPYSSSKKY